MLQIRKNSIQMEFDLYCLAFEMIKGFSMLQICSCLIPRNTDLLHIVNGMLLGSVRNLEHVQNL